MLEASGYSSTYKADYLAALYGNTTSNSTVAINADYTPSTFQLGSFAVKQNVPVTVSKAGITTCRSYGDPHISTFDKLSYGFQKAGGWCSPHPLLLRPKRVIAILSALHTLIVTSCHASSCQAPVALWPVKGYPTNPVSTSLYPGVFYLTRSRSGDFVVQVRQFACSSTVTCNQAVRIRYGTSVVTLDPTYKYVHSVSPRSSDRREATIYAVC